MAAIITDGEISAERFLRALQTKAPANVRDPFIAMIARSDWQGFVNGTAALVKSMKLSPFTAPEIAEVGVLSQAQQDIYVFIGAIADPRAAAVKSKVDGLLAWGAWDSVARLAASIPNAPFSFTAADVKRVFDPSGTLPEMTFGQAQAKTFLNTIATDPNAAAINAQISKLAEWGGWETIAALVSSHPNIPFKFTADDVRAVADPAKAVTARAPDVIAKMQDVWSFYSGLQTASTGDANVASFFNDIQARVQHGCWKSIADTVNGNDKIPFKNFEIPILQAVLDPTGKYGNDDACSALAPPEAPTWTKPIVWTVTAGLTAYNWTLGAADDVKDWTTGAAGSVADWTEGAAGSVADWTSGATMDAVDWTSGAASDAGGWIKGAANSTGDWVSGAAGSTADWTKGAANTVGDWAKDAGSSISHAFNPSSW